MAQSREQEAVGDWFFGAASAVKGALLTKEVWSAAGSAVGGETGGRIGGSIGGFLEQKTSKAPEPPRRVWQFELAAGRVLQVPMVDGRLLFLRGEADYAVYAPESPVDPPREFLEYATRTGDTGVADAGDGQVIDLLTGSRRRKVYGGGG